MMNMGSALVLADKRSLQQHLLRSHQMSDVVDEKGMQAWLSPRVHCLYSAVYKRGPPGERDVCASQAQGGSQALPSRLHRLWELTHSCWQKGKVEGGKEEAAGRGAADGGLAVGAPGSSGVD